MTTLQIALLSALERLTCCMLNSLQRLSLPDLRPDFSCFFYLLRPFFILMAIILCKGTNGL